MIKQLLFFFLLVSFSGLAQNSTPFCKQLAAMDSIIAHKHYQPKPLDDNLAIGVLDLFIERIDPENRFLTAQDISAIKTNNNAIDEFIINNNCDFINAYIALFEKRILGIKANIEKLKSTELDYSGGDTLYFMPRSSKYIFKDDAQLHRYWSKRVRYKVITKLIDEDSIFDRVITNFQTSEIRVKPTVIANELCLLDEVLNQNGGIDAFVKDSFLNALVQYQDPNSSYFNSTEKRVFENSLSSNKMSFGIVPFKDKNGSIKVAHIIPGSAAFKNGKIETNDKILSISAGGIRMETTCITTEDVIEFMNDERYKSMTFKINKKNGSTQEIELIKTKIKVQENAIRAYLIGEENPIGYFKVPSFYTNLESPNGLGLSNDIAKELYRLEKENINGLIIDLRYNGGGSMREAANLSGMFIDRGPLAILKFNNGKNFTIKDPKKGASFKKPILILINNYSASASEFFASAMQDYNRAILVGSPTHGKSSAQVILPLHKTENWGFTKLTIEAFYRVTGSSHQSTGVIPDIELPSFYDNLQSSELFMKYALKNDSIKPRLIHKPLTNFNRLAIANKSKQRTNLSTSFSIVKSRNETFVKDYFNSSKSYALTLENVYSDRKKFNDYWDKLSEDQTKFDSKINVSNTKSTTEVLLFEDSDTKEENTSLLKDLSQDIYIQEGYNIMQDYIYELKISH